MALTNPNLSELRFLVGAWGMAITNASFLDDPKDVVHSPVAFEAIEYGALLAMRQGGGALSPAAATWLSGRDDHQREYTVLYADARGVSRVYLMSLSGNIWRIWRDEPAFSQRFEATVSPDRRSITGAGRSAHGAATGSTTSISPTHATYAEAATSSNASQAELRARPAS